MSNYQSGHDAEKQAAIYLEHNGYKVIELNWKTRYCEIDIVAKKAKIVYFVEVKARKNDQQGVGSDYITPKKLNQMIFAAQMWVSEHTWSGDYELSVMSIDNDEVTFIPQLNS